MGLSPLFQTSADGEGVTRVRANRHAHSAVTQYRVLDSTNSCSLVELQPVTGQISRLVFGTGLLWTAYSHLG